MKTAFNRSQKILVIRQVLAEHPEVFEGKSEALLVCHLFLEQSQLLLQKITLLAEPASTVWVERMANSQLFDDLLYKMLNIGMLLARRKGDLGMENSFKAYSRVIHRSSISRAIAIAEMEVSTFAANEDSLYLRWVLILKHVVSLSSCIWSWIVICATMPLTIRSLRSAIKSFAGHVPSHQHQSCQPNRISVAGSQTPKPAKPLLVQ